MVAYLFLHVYRCCTQQELVLMWSTLMMWPTPSTSGMCRDVGDDVDVHQVFNECLFIAVAATIPKNIIVFVIEKYTINNSLWSDCALIMF